MRVPVPRDVPAGRRHDALSQADRRLCRRRQFRRPRRVKVEPRGADPADRRGLCRLPASAAPGPSRSSSARSSTIPRPRRTTVRRLRSAEERQHRRRQGAADVPGHRHRDRHGQEGPARVDRRRRRGGARRGHPRAPTPRPICATARWRRSSMYEEVNTGDNLPAQIDLYAEPTATNTNSCSSPRAAARPTRAFSTSRRRRC